MLPIGLAKKFTRIFLWQQTENPNELLVQPNIVKNIKLGVHFLSSSLPQSVLDQKVAGLIFQAGSAFIA